MPIYEFLCQACGNEIEVLQKISDPHPTDCEVCGKAEMKKKVTAAAFRLSGAGWYETDFKEGDKKKNLTETPADNKDSKTETKSDSESKSSDKKTDKSSDKTSNKTETSSQTSKPKKTEKPKKD